MLYFGKTRLLILFLISLEAISAQTLNLTLLHNNDTHGRYLPDPKSREYGMPLLGSIIKNIRDRVKASGGGLLLLSAGDINTGTPESDHFDAEPDFKAMNNLEYDAMALGNHEFDKPLEILIKQSSWAEFPFLAANISVASSKMSQIKNFFRPYIIRNINGFKILIIGLTTFETATYKGAKDLIIEDEVPFAKSYIPKIQNLERPDFTIVLTHIGFYPERGLTNNLKGDIDLANSLPRGSVDLIIGGHTQKAIVQPHIVNDIPIVQAGEWGKFLGEANFSLEKGKKGVLSSYRLISVNYMPKETDFATPFQWSLRSKIIAHTTYKNLNINKTLERTLSEWFSKHPRKLDEVVGELDNFFAGRPSGKGIETNLGRLVANSYCDITQADICWTNNGGLRTDMDKGFVQIREVLALLPFKNSLCSYWMKGSRLGDFLAKNILGNPKIHDEKNGNPLHFFGFKMERHKGRITSLKIRKKTQNIDELSPKKKVISGLLYEARMPREMTLIIDGKSNPLLNNTYFKITSPCFLTGAKDLTDVEILDTKYYDEFALQQFLKKKGLISSQAYTEPSIVDK